MKIPTEEKQKWQSLREHGDINKMSEGSPYSRFVIMGAMNGEDCTMDVFAHIKNFYAKREAKLNKLIGK